MDEGTRLFLRQVRIRRALGRIAALGVPAADREALVYARMFASEAEAVAYPFALGYGFLPDLDTPRRLNEKIRTLLLRHPSPLATIVADKLAVRDYIRHMGARTPAPEVHFATEDPDDPRLTWDLLPEACVIKTNDGSGTVMIRSATSALTGASYRRKLRRWQMGRYWRRHSEFAYKDIPRRYFVETHIPAHRSRIDYKVFCYHGEPVHISAITSRGRDFKGGLVRGMYSPDWQRLGFGTRMLQTSDETIPPPVQLDQILDDARLLSGPFPHARIDFMCHDDALWFSEVTLSNLGARLPLAPDRADFELGERIDMARLPESLLHETALARALGRTGGTTWGHWQGSAAIGRS